MARPSRTGGKTSRAKARDAKGRQTTKTKRRIAPAATRTKRRSVSGSGTDLKEAREQQTATADILKVIASSPSDVQPVFDTIVANADRLIGGFTTGVYRFVGSMCHLATFTPTSPAADELLKSRFPCPIAGRPNFALAQAGETVEIPDTEAQPDLSLTETARARGFRSLLYSPLMSKGTAIGVIVVTRRNPGPFSSYHVELLRTFSDQAVIAIENTRLFNDVQDKTADLSESLQQQTATADVLKVISRSAFDLQAVLKTLVKSAARLCQAENVQIFLRDGDLYRLAAHNGFSPEYQAYVEQHPVSPGRGTVAARTALELTPVHIPDVFLDPEYTFLEGQRLAGFRALLGVPLLREGSCIGVMALTKAIPTPFTARQAELATTFADQAVIAIENVRLFDETREALERQTATADILKVIASSPSDVQPVFAAIAKSANRLLGGFSTAVFRFLDGDVHLAAFTPTNPAADKVLTTRFPQTFAEFPAFDWVRGGAVAQIADTESGAWPGMLDLARARGFRAMLLTPLMSNGIPIGLISVTRRNPGSFAEHHVQLLQTFSDQAVIAIENVRLFNETKEALERQTATAEILKVINNSPGDLAPVFEVILEKATLICGASFGVFTMYEGDDMHQVVATRGVPSAVADLWRRPVRLGPETGMGRLVRGENFVHIIDASDDVGYRLGNPVRRALVDIAGARTYLAVPLRRDEVIIGAFTIYRRDVRPFIEKQIALLQTFADQAVIAIENARLFDEVQAKTRDLTEALTYQTGSGNILSVIASSPTNVGPVLEAIVASACKLCESYDAAVYLRDGEDLCFAAHHGPISTGLDRVQLSRNWVTGRSVIDKKPIHVHDLLSEGEEFPEGKEFARRLGHRTILAVPLLLKGDSIGAINLRRTEVHPFSEKQIALLQTFADQAVIAIGNVRLFEEVQARTRDLTESLQQQTATADVLKVISRSSVDLETVLDTLVDTVVRLCRADQALMYRQKDDRYHLVAVRGLSAEVKKFILANPFAADRGTVAGRAVLEHRAVHIPDALQDPEYHYEGAKLAGGRTLLGIPLLREDVLIGILVVVRTRADPFTPKEIELATSFSDQAVIAIENARLFEELRDRQAELRVTFDNMGDGVVMFDAAARLTAWNRNFQEMLDLPDAFLAGRPSYAKYFRYLADRGEYSTDLEAQLSRTIEDISRDIEMRFERTRPDGRVIEVRRNPVPSGGFVLIYSDITERKHAEEAIRTARDTAEAALRDLQTAQDRLIQTEKLASLGQLTAGIAHEIKNPLNFVNNFSALSAELTDELNDALRPVAMDGKVREEVNELTGLLKENLEKVVQHGKRADSIVKNMLLHSREGSGEHRPADINSLLDESLNLAYHGARAENGEFNVTLERDFDADAGTIELFPQEITRAFLNLISNGVYAATRRKTEDKEPGFELTLRASTKNLGTTVEIRIRDNGTGIPPEVQEKMFNPFFTTKPAGEGTGLGLSMTHDIIVKQHGGRIDVDTEPGKFTEFIITLPRTTILPKTAGDSN